jgi:hypothetical protein
MEVPRVRSRAAPVSRRARGAAGADRDVGGISPPRSSVALFAHRAGPVENPRRPPWRPSGCRCCWRRRDSSELKPTAPRRGRAVMNIPTVTAASWERGRRKPTGAAPRLLDHSPQAPRSIVRWCDAPTARPVAKIRISRGIWQELTEPRAEENIEHGYPVQRPRTSPRYKSRRLRRPRFRRQPNSNASSQSPNWALLDSDVSASRSAAA